MARRSTCPCILRASTNWPTVRDSVTGATSGLAVTDAARSDGDRVWLVGAVRAADPLRADAARRHWADGVAQVTTCRARRRIAACMDWLAVVVILALLFLAVLFAILLIETR